MTKKNILKNIPKSLCLGCNCIRSGLWRLNTNYEKKNSSLIIDNQKREKSTDTESFFSSIVVFFLVSTGGVLELVLMLVFPCMFQIFDSPKCFFFLKFWCSLITLSRGLEMKVLCLIAPWVWLVSDHFSFPKSVHFFHWKGPHIDFCINFCVSSISVMVSVSKKIQVKIQYRNEIILNWKNCWKN